MKSSVTISLVPEARSGPFVFHDDLPWACEAARRLGFDAVELFPSAADAVPVAEFAKLLADHNLALAAVGTGAGWVRQQLTLTSPDAVVRTKALDFVSRIIDFAAAFGAPAIIGSMQGRQNDGTDRETVFQHLIESLAILGERAESQGTILLYEPLNRYETNLVNRLADGADLLNRVGQPNAKLLADLFHMNIEEADMTATIRAAGSHIGHVHLADSNRRPAGGGHTDFAPVGQALRDIGYSGYVSAEAYPIPDSMTAAGMTMNAMREYFRH